MPVSPARQTAFDILLAVELRSAFAADLLLGNPAQRLSHPDHRLATELTLGVLRRRGVLDWFLAPRLSRPLAKMDPEPLLALRMGLYQLLYLDRIPAHALVNDAVELVKATRRAAAAPTVNAVLRGFLRKPVALRQAPAHVQRSHPEWLCQRWEALMGNELMTATCAYGNEPPPLVARSNSAGLDIAQLQHKFADEGIKTGPGRLLKSALTLQGDGASSLLLQDGRAWLQDEASQLIAHLFVAALGQGPASVLDACAAPGGKSSLLKLLLTASCPATPADFPPAVVALERSRARAKQMALRLPDTPVLVGNAAQPLPFRRAWGGILLDAPCTGTGTLARNPEIRWRLTPADPQRMQTLQRQMLRNLLPSLASGGILLYSVCSLEPEEGEQVIENVLADMPGFEVVPAAPLLRKLQPVLASNAADLSQADYLRTIPGRDGCDGFFAALIRRS